jgi:hypothetical protein
VLLTLEHLDRRRWATEITRINERINESAVRD